MGRKSVRKFLMHNSNAKFGILAFLGPTVNNTPAQERKEKGLTLFSVTLSLFPAAARSFLKESCWTDLRTRSLYGRKAVSGGVDGNESLHCRMIDEANYRECDWGLLRDYCFVETS
ncbi:hypothetical protein WR25_18914 [Diploscapter pachys]|uniref:Uncharacterized protein n=1 Tax=Diploscapter pachys TaxID=2018661 RepID=A0A2A2KHK4_9BILA|nr:hypothetical protein WR25_18914 [Diploscapter pachys]